MFQPALTRQDFDTDSAMGGSIFTDDKSMCTFATDEEVSEFCVHKYQRRGAGVLCNILLYSAPCAIQVGHLVICLCVWRAGIGCPGVCA